MKANFPEFHQIEYVVVKLGGFRGPVTASLLPPHLTWIDGSRSDGRPILRIHGVPFFFAVVDDQVWGQGHGVSGLESVVLPQLRLAIAERTAAKS
jgi:hypothetical protein